MTTTGRRLIRTGAAMAAALAVTATSLALTTSAIASTTWSFTGQVTTPDRYGGKATIAGDISIPEGVSCLGTEDIGQNYRISCAVFLVPQDADGNIPSFIPERNFDSSGLPRYHVIPLATVPRGVNGPTTVYISGETYGDIPTGKTWRWVIGGYQFRAGCTAPGCIYGTYISANLADFSPAITMPTQASERFVTSSSVPSIVSGGSVTLSMTRRVMWSDGVETIEPTTQPIQLQFRATGSATWSDAGSGTSVTLSPAAPGDYRFLVNGRTTEPVFVNVIRPTSANRVSGVSVSPSSAVANVPLVFSGVLETQYDDEVWRPAPVGTAYELQFLADGGSGWSRLASERVTQAGVVSVRWPMLGSGRFRIVAGAATSESVAVTEVKPTSVVAADPLNLPSEVFPGDPVDISVGVDVQFSDGVYRDAPDGTPFAVEFAESFDPNAVAATAPRSALVWKTLATGKTEGGKADAQVSPRTSGFWRMAFGQNRTSPVYVEVVGSKPEAPRPVALRLSGSPSTSSVSWAFTPVAGVTYEASASTRSGRVDASQITLEQSGRVSVSGLPARTAVTVLVTGTDSFGQTDGGATATATTANSTPQPGVTPGPVTAINVSAPSRGRVTVTWTPPTTGGTVTSYQYRVRAGKWTAWRSVTAPRVTLTMPTRNRPTTIQIRAVNTTGNGPTQQALL